MLHFSKNRTASRETHSLPLRLLSWALCFTLAICLAGRSAQSQTLIPSRSDRLDLGPLPSAFQIHWPEPPLIEHEEVATSAAEFASRLRPRTRMHVRGTLSTVTLSVSDVELVMSAEARIKRLNIAPGVHRIKVIGGSFGEIEVGIPATENDFATDLYFDRVHVAPDSDQYGLAFALRAKRAAVVHCNVQAFVYSVWVGGTAPMQSTDLIFLGNEFNSTTGNEATFRMHDALRTVVVENRFTNGTASMINSKHNYRIHGISGQNFAARNVLIHSGVMIGEGGGDPMEEINGYWFLENTFYQLRPSLYQMGANSVRNAVIKNNRVYNGSPMTCLVCNWPLPSSWTAIGNRLLPYRPHP
jgi:hypothetical protein